MLVAGAVYKESEETWANVLLAFAGYSIFLYPVLALGALAYLLALHFLGGRDNQRVLSVALSPVVVLPLTLIFLAAGAFEAIPWLLAGCVAYGLLVRPPSPAPPTADGSPATT